MPLFEGVIQANGIGGARLLELVRADSYRPLSEEFSKLKISSAKKLQNAISRHVSTNAGGNTRRDRDRRSTSAQGQYFELDSELVQAAQSSNDQA